MSWASQYDEIRQLIPAPGWRAFEGWLEEGEFKYEELAVVGWVIARRLHVVARRSDADEEVQWVPSLEPEWGDELKLYVLEAPFEASGTPCPIDLTERTSGTASWVTVPPNQEPPLARLELEVRRKEEAAKK